MDEPHALRLDMAAVPLLVVAAAFTGWVELRSDEVQPTVALLLLFTALLAFARPHKPWRWAVLMAAAVPLAYLAAPCSVSRRDRSRSPTSPPRCSR